jgi:glycosyltransferase involved in cell wall biosynthesis
MRRIRVLTLISDLMFGGAESRVLSLARNINQWRFEHFVAVLNRAEPQRSDYYGSLRPAFRQSGIELVEFDEPPNKFFSRGRGPLRYAHGSRALWRMVRKVRRFVRIRGIDVIDAHGWIASLVGALSGAWCGIPRIVTLYEASSSSDHFLTGLKVFSRLAQTLVSDSTVRATEIARAGGNRRLSVAVIPNGIEQPVSARTKSEMRACLGLPADPNIPIIGQVAGLGERKGHLVLLDAIRAVVDQRPDVAFLFVGHPRSADYRRRVDARIEELGLARHVRVLGYPGPIGDVFQAIDIQVHAATIESLPIAITEGMATGKPAVVTSVGGVLTMVEDGVTGLVVAPGDAKALARGILRLLDEPDTAARLGMAARRRFLAEYDAPIMARRLEKLFESVVGGRDRSHVARPSEIPLSRGSYDPA